MQYTIGYHMRHPGLPRKRKRYSKVNGAQSQKSLERTKCILKMRWKIKKFKKKIKKKLSLERKRQKAIREAEDYFALMRKRLLKRKKYLIRQRVYKKRARVLRKLKKLHMLMKHGLLPKKVKRQILRRAFRKAKAHNTIKLSEFLLEAIMLIQPQHNKVIEQIQRYQEYLDSLRERIKLKCIGKRKTSHQHQQHSEHEDNVSSEENVLESTKSRKIHKKRKEDDLLSEKRQRKKYFRKRYTRLEKNEINAEPEEKHEQKRSKKLHTTRKSETDREEKYKKTPFRPTWKRGKRKSSIKTKEQIDIIEKHGEVESKSEAEGNVVVRRRSDVKRKSKDGKNDVGSKSEADRKIVVRRRSDAKKKSKDATSEEKGNILERNKSDIMRKMKTGRKNDVGSKSEAEEKSEIKRKNEDEGKIEVESKNDAEAKSELKDKIETEAKSKIKGKIEAEAKSEIKEKNEIKRKSSVGSKNEQIQRGKEDKKIEAVGYAYKHLEAVGSAHRFDKSKRSFYSRRSRKQILQDDRRSLEEDKVIFRKSSQRLPKKMGMPKEFLQSQRIIVPSMHDEVMREKKKSEAILKARLEAETRIGAKQAAAAEAAKIEEKEKRERMAAAIEAEKKRRQEMKRQRKEEIENMLQERTSILKQDDKQPHWEEEQENLYMTYGKKLALTDSPLEASASTSLAQPRDPSLKKSPLSALELKNQDFTIDIKRLEESLKQRLSIKSPRENNSVTKKPKEEQMKKIEKPPKRKSHSETFDFSVYFHPQYMHFIYPSKIKDKPNIEKKRFTFQPRTSRYSGRIDKRIIVNRTGSYAKFFRASEIQSTYRNVQYEPIKLFEFHNAKEYKKNFIEASGNIDRLIRDDYDDLDAHDKEQTVVWQDIPETKAPPSTPVKVKDYMFQQEQQRWRRKLLLCKQEAAQNKGNEEQQKLREQQIREKKKKIRNIREIVFKLKEYQDKQTKRAKIDAEQNEILEQKLTEEQCRSCGMPLKGPNKIHLCCKWKPMPIKSNKN